MPLGSLDGGRVGFGEAPGPSPVPEPGSLVLLATGLAGVLPFMRRRRQWPAPQDW